MDNVNIPSYGMYRVDCVNKKTGAEFSKEFQSPYHCRNFVTKCKHSKEVKVIKSPSAIWR